MESFFMKDREGHSVLPTLQIWIRIYSLLWWMNSKTYNQTGSKEIWCASGSSGLEKRQCTVQLMIADGVSRVRPLVIFRGKGLHIKAEEKQKWDKRVKVLFKKNAWCNEKMMKEWTANEWANYFTNPPTPGSSGIILVAEVHRAQQTANVKKLLQNKPTLLINVPLGCTSHLNMRFESTSRNTWVKISTFTPKINYLCQKEECLLQNGLRKVGKKYHETKKL